MIHTWFRVPRMFYAGAVIGGLSCLFLAGAVATQWLRLGLLAMSAVHWASLIDATRAGVWLRIDGLDVRHPMQRQVHHVVWGDIEQLERRPRGKKARPRLVLHLGEERVLNLPAVRDQEELAAAIDAHVA